MGNNERGDRGRGEHEEATRPTRRKPSRKVVKVEREGTAAAAFTSTAALIVVTLRRTRDVAVDSPRRPRSRARERRRVGVFAVLVLVRLVSVGLRASTLLDGDADLKDGAQECVFCRRSCGGLLRRRRRRDLLLRTALQLERPVDFVPARRRLAFRASALPLPPLALPVLPPPLPRLLRPLLPPPTQLAHLVPPTEPTRAQLRREARVAQPRGELRRLRERERLGRAGERVRVRDAVRRRGAVARVERDGTDDVRAGAGALRGEVRRVGWRGWRVAPGRVDG